MLPIQCIAFDMDDTLLDTSQLLVPLAARRSCEAMLNAGVPSDMDTCLQWRAGQAAEKTHSEIFESFIQKFGSPEPEAALQSALKAFYNPEVPARLPLMEGAENNLKVLCQKYSLFLVTSGEPAAQAKKVASLGIEKYFKKIFFVNNFLKETKQTAFAEIIETEKIQPEQLLSVGNRLSQEIRYAKVCGARTCYFCYGEHVGEIPSLREDYPDVTIYKHAELVAAFAL